ncbi:unnamed protein product [Rotaria magnacalcarata]|uniref:Uncharacterized protein n=1 Tax=Rotaria magnacalcarata TaxID=392030 RepID=A0A816S162_9BILA|nr:unnamed protein product [Rotaria magnacalcarata]CAF2057321.1 unnamed protein product [Rotaria magnacalcarata]CAF2082386.1 unnamed protein product [Rotaria magnacalcarata]CAF2151252.1 unnamed protein product [Rotaria magnacalcarata]CAF4004864.1 unnamed protein product [Rotaria magnacalcarata]
MRSYGIFFIGIFSIGLYTPCEGIFGSSSLQDYIDSLVDAARFKFDGVLSLNDSAIHQIWSFFKNKYGRVYSSIDEEKQRLRVFRDHLQYVLESNLQNLLTFELELNEFADWTSDEFNSLKKGLIVSTSFRRDMIIYNQDLLQPGLRKLHRRPYHSRRLKRRLHHERFFRDWFSNMFHSGKDKDNAIHQSNVFDWRTKSVVSSVKDQRKCGCCYAFATATIMETLYAIKTNSSTTVDFSPQQIADCSSNGNTGCSGGNFGPSVRYLLDNGGKIATESSYPYAGTRKSCRTSGLNEIQLGNIEYGMIPEGDEKKLADALTNYGPIFIGIDTDSKRFMFYKRGVLKIDNCPTRRQDMDHAMAIVGYGYDDTLQMSYWIIKNSWGKKWGEQGYLRLAKDAGNMCGVASMAYYGKLT